MTPLKTSDGVVTCHLSFLVKALKRDMGVNDYITYGHYESPLPKQRHPFDVA